MPRIERDRALVGAAGRVEAADAAVGDAERVVDLGQLRAGLGRALQCRYADLLRVWPCECGFHLAADDFAHIIQLRRRRRFVFVTDHITSYGRRADK